jgi:hypothetical protein
MNRASGVSKSMAVTTVSLFLAKMQAGTQHSEETLPLVISFTYELSDC